MNAFYRFSDLKESQKKNGLQKINVRNPRNCISGSEDLHPLFFVQIIKKLTEKLSRIIWIHKADLHQLIT